MIDKLKMIEDKYDGLNRLLSDPKVLATPAEFQKYSREHAELQPIVEKIIGYRKLLGEYLESTEELLSSGDAEIKELGKAELEDLKKRRPAFEEELRLMLLPADPRDAKSVILEIRAGTGGEEAALFGANLLRMYTKYAESKRWKVEVISMNATGIGGIKEVVASIEGKGARLRSGGCGVARQHAQTGLATVRAHAERCIRASAARRKLGKPRGTDDREHDDATLAAHRRLAPRARRCCGGRWLHVRPRGDDLASRSS